MKSKSVKFFRPFALEMALQLACGAEAVKPFSRKIRRVMKAVEVSLRLDRNHRVSWNFDFGLPPGFSSDASKKSRCNVTFSYYEGIDNDRITSGTDFSKFVWANIRLEKRHPVPGGKGELWEVTRSYDHSIRFGSHESWPACPYKIETGLGGTESLTIREFSLDVRRSLRFGKGSRFPHRHGD